MDKYTLNRNACLTRIPEPSGRAALTGQIQIGIRLDHHTGIASQLQYDLFFSRLGFEFPSDRSAAGKAEQFEAGIRHKLLGHGIRARNDVKPSGRQSSLQGNFSQEQCRQWSLRSRLDQNGITACQRGSDFVRHEVERKIKW